MTTKNFLKSCEKAGCLVKLVKGGSYSIRHGQNSIKISRSTRKLDGPAIKVYLKNLGLSESTAGITGNEFQDGVSSEREQINQYIAVLRRLART